MEKKLHKGTLAALVLTVVLTLAALLFPGLPGLSAGALVFALLALACFLRQRRLWRERQESANYILRETSFSRLLNGDIRHFHDSFEEDWLNNSERFTGRRAFEENGFCVLYFELGDVVSETVDEENILAERICRCVEERARRLVPAECVAMSGDAVCILNFAAHALSEEEQLQSFRTLAEQIVEELETGLGVLTTCDVSRLKEGLSRVPEAYQETLEVKNYRKMCCLIQRVLSYENMSFKRGQQDRAFGVPDMGHALEQERRFINCVLARDYMQAKAIMNEMLDSEFGSRAPVLPLAANRLQGLINLMMNAVDHLRPTLERDFFETLFPQNNLAEVSSPEELREKVNHIFDRVVQEQQEREKGSGRSWVREMETYIAQAYQQQDLNVQKVADHFELNAAYASRNFKAETGLGVLDYIQVVRIQKAKQLLAQGVLVKDAAESVGFSNTRAMTRAFLKHEGVTPGRFNQ